MIEQLTRTALSTLAETAGAPTLSCYLPTHRTDPSPERDMAELERLLEGVPPLLLEAGVYEAVGQKLLQPFRDFLAEPELWRAREASLALFSAPGTWRILTSSVSLPPRVEIGFRPVIAPLVVALPPEERFYILALSINRVRVIEVGPGTVQSREVPGLPQGMQDALGYEQFESSLQAHSATSRGLGRREPVFHGHGDADEERFKSDLETYFHRVAQALEAALVSDTPRILATVEAYVPIYRRASADGKLVEEVILGNPDARTDGELAERAREILMRRAESTQEKEYLALQECSPENKAMGVDEVVTAAHQGRIHALYIAPDARSWGTFEPDLGRVEIHGERLAGDDDLIDLAVARTLAQGGKASALPAERGEYEIAAILRF